MKNDISYHDAQVNTISYDKFEAKLILRLNLLNNENLVIEFQKTIYWDLSPFEEQNILFDIHEFDQNSLPDWIVKDFEIPSQITNLVFSGQAKVYYIEPSIGLGGYIAAQKINCI